MSSDEIEEIAERQQAELDFIDAAYSSDEAWIQKSKYNNDTTIHVVYRRLNLPLETDDDNNCKSLDSLEIDLIVSMPPRYPIDESSPLIIDTSIANHRKRHGSLLDSSSARKLGLDASPKLVEILRAEARDNAGQESLLTIFARAEEWIETDWKDILDETITFSSQAINGCEKKTISNMDPTNPMILARKLIYSHHIIAKSKRKAIADLSRDFQLGGYAKIGWPGIIIIEGEESNCDKFYDTIRPMKWQHLVMRGEERLLIENHDINSLNAKRCFPIKMVELAEDQMSHLADICREANIEALFKTSMRMYEKKEDSIIDKQTGTDEVDTEAQYGVMVHVDHMNDRKGYEKWIQKACKSTGCKELIVRCGKNQPCQNTRMTIVVCIFGEEESVKQVLKRWRISRVDVDSKGVPCLERMMKVIVEGNIVEKSDMNEVLDEASAKINEDGVISSNDFKELCFSVGAVTWRDALQQVLNLT